MSEAKDQDLLTRLNALKQSHIDLNAKQISGLRAPASSDPSSSLSHDIAARLRALSPQSSSPQPMKNGTPLDIPELQNESNDKTVEELLDELGPAEQWTVSANEEQEITNLLKEARALLPETREDDSADSDVDPKSHEQDNRLPRIDVSVFAPEPEPPPDENHSSRPPHPSEDQEADSLLQRILDEIQHEPPEPESEARGTAQPTSPEVPNSPGASQQELPPPSYSSHNFPASPSSLPSNDDDNNNTDLSSRFSALTLPSVPSTLPQSKHTPTTASTKKPKQEPAEGGEEEEDQYCVICFADPQVRCLGPGCDGDLYCNLCWNEGHRGEDVGREMRSHKALMLNRGGGVEDNADQQGKRKVVLKRPKGRLVGA